jgi:hypothetical protein
MKILADRLSNWVSTDADDDLLYIINFTYQRAYFNF